MTGRDTLIDAAREANANLWNLGPGKFEGASDPELACALYVLAGAGERTAGDVQYGLHATLMFPYILTEDGQGFCDVLGPYATREAADAAMEAADAVLPKEAE